MSDANDFRLRHARSWRILRAGSAGLVVMMLVSLVATIEGSRPPVPDVFGVARPHLGDQGAYDFEVERKTLTRSEIAWSKDDAFRFEVVAPRDSFAPDGTHQRSHAIDYRALTFVLAEGDVPVGFQPVLEGGYRVAANLHLSDPETGAYHGTSTQRTFDGASDGAGGANRIQEQRWLNTTHLLSPEPGPHRVLIRADLCGLTHPLQRQTLATHRSVALLQDCDLAGRTIRNETFRAVAALQLHGETCVEYETAWHQDEQARALLCQSNPYPVRMEFHQRAYDAISRYTLSSFQRGAAPPTYGEAAPGQPLRPVLAPLRPWGPNDAGVDHPFPASDAYAFAAQDPRMKEFLAEHPDSFLRRLEHRERSEESAVNHTWRFQYQAANATLHVRVEHATTPSGSGPVTRLSITSEQSHLSDVTFDARNVPDQVPTVAWMLQAWRQHTRSQGEPNTWSYALEYPAQGCRDPIQAEDGSEAYASCPLAPILSAGVDRLVAMPFGPEGSSINGTESDEEDRLYFDERGLLTKIREHVILTRNEPTGNPDGVIRIAPGPSFIVALRGPDIEFPRRGTLPAILGVTVAALVWLAPHVQRLGGLALFSRILRPRALDHPARAQILAAVEASPGASIGEICVKIQLPRSTVEHHLRKLVGVGLVQMTRGNGYACLFPPNMVSARVARLVPHLRSEGVRGLLEQLERHPSLSAGEAAKTLGVDPATLSDLSRRLQSLQAIEVRREGRERRLLLTDAGRAGLDFIRST